MKLNLAGRTGNTHNKARLNQISPQFNKCKNPKGDDESFNAEDNENELCSIALEKKPLKCNEGSKKLIHFDQDMYKHGLLDKIDHIQELNNYLESEFGAGNKKNSCPSPTPINQCSPSNKGYSFPFHKRTRSNSPIKNGSILDPKMTQGQCMKSPTNLQRKPIVPQANFVIGKAARLLNYPETKIIEEDLCCGLSTGPTSEIRDLQDSDGLDGWMYKRINAGKDGEENIPIDDDGMSFMQMINQS